VDRKAITLSVGQIMLVGLQNDIEGTGESQHEFGEFTEVALQRSKVGVKLDEER